MGVASNIKRWVIDYVASVGGGGGVWGSITGTIGSQTDLQAQFTAYKDDALTFTNKVIDGASNTVTNTTAKAVRVKSDSSLPGTCTKGDLYELANGTMYIATATNVWTQIFTALDEVGSVNSQTGTTYTYVDADHRALVTHSNASAIAGTLPQANSTTFRAGWYMDLQNNGVGILTITPTTSTINGAASLIISQFQGVRIFSDGTNYFAQRGSPPLVTATATGTDTYAATVAPAITAYVANQRFYITFTNANTGAATLNINSLGAKSIVKNGSTALVSGDIPAGSIKLLQYDGTNLQIVGDGGGSTATTFSGTGVAMLLPNNPDMTSAPAAQAVTANTVYVYKILIPVAVTIAKITFRATGVASSHASAGIYSADGNTLILDGGAQDTAATAYKVSTFGSPVTLPAGFYFLAVTTDTSTASLFGVVMTATMVNTLNNAQVQVGTATNASAAGVLPATLGALTGATNFLIPVGIQG